MPEEEIQCQLSGGLDTVCVQYQQCFSDWQCVCGVTLTQSDLCVTGAVKQQKLFTNSVLNNKLCITCADEISLVNNSGALLHLKISIWIYFLFDRDDAI